MANSTVNDTRITNDKYPANIWHQNVNRPMVDIRRGGQFGWHTDMEGIVNSTPHVSNNLIVRVLASPKGFNDLPNAEVWHGSWKALFELQATSVTGLMKTLQPQWTSTEWGGAGEEIDVPIGMKRDKSEVVFTLNEKSGLVFTEMLEQFHRMFIMDEDTKHPGIAMLKNDIPDGLLDYYTWTMIFIEPDRYLQHPQRAWIVANMAPKTSAQQESKRDKKTDQETLDIEVSMTGVAQIGYAVDMVAASILKSMRQTQADPLRAPAYLQGPTADIADRNDVGFQEMMEKANREMLAPDV